MQPYHVAARESHTGLLLPEQVEVFVPIGAQLPRYMHACHDFLIKGICIVDAKRQHKRRKSGRMPRMHSFWPKQPPKRPAVPEVFNRQRCVTACGFLPTGGPLHDRPLQLIRGNIDRGDGPEYHHTRTVYNNRHSRRRAVLRTGDKLQLSSSAGW